MNVPTIQQVMAEGKKPDVLFWVGCAGSFDQRAQSVTKAFVKILNSLDINFAILGTEESCTGDPARRAGHEMNFQMLALQNISVLNGYEIENIVTACPHCFNTLKNEYPELGGNYNVLHHSQYLQQLINEGKLAIKEGGQFKGKKIVFHDSCYLGRANQVYEAPREILEKLDGELAELKRCKEKGLCCGAGGAQMFKEDEPGETRINLERAEEIKTEQPDIVAASCPFCMTMLSDGVKYTGMDEKTEVKDIAELIAEANDII